MSEDPLEKLPIENPSIKELNPGDKLRDPAGNLYLVRGDPEDRGKELVSRNASRDKVVGVENITGKGQSYIKVENLSLYKIVDRRYFD